MPWVEPISEGRPTYHLCPSCGHIWKAWHNAPRRKYRDYPDHCTPCYAGATCTIRHREQKRRARLPTSAAAAASSSYTRAGRQRAPWLVKWPALYRGETTPDPGTGLRARWNEANPISAGGSSHAACKTVANLGRQVGRHTVML